MHDGVTGSHPITQKDDNSRVTLPKKTRKMLSDTRDNVAKILVEVKKGRDKGENSEMNAKLEHLLSEVLAAFQDTQNTNIENVYDLELYKSSFLALRSVTTPQVMQQAIQHQPKLGEAHYRHVGLECQPPSKP